MSSSDEIFREILAWTRVGFYGTAKQMLSDVLNSDKKKLAYQAADGTRSTESIRVAVRIGSNELGELFKQCTNLGLMEQMDGGRRRRLFDLSNFGLLPQVVAGGGADDEQAKA